MAHLGLFIHRLNLLGESRQFIRHPDHLKDREIPLKEILEIL